MLLKLMLACTLLTGAAGKLYSQNAHNTIALTKKWDAISIGETLPDITVSGFLDDSTKQVKLSDLYKGKLLLLNFWATSCGGCIKEIRQLKELKKRYAGKLDILLVTYEPRNKVAKCNDRFKLFDDGTLKTLVGDKLLHELFPHTMVPQFAWINSNGKVMAVTDQMSLRDENIVKGIEGDVKLREKKDNMSFLPGDAFHLRDSDYMARSIITGKTEGINNYGTSFPVPMISRIFISNLSLFHLYASAAFSNSQFECIKYRMFIETNDSLKFFTPSMAQESFRKSKYKDYNEWADENAYCYDLDFRKPMPQQQMREYMIQDLNRYFGLNGHFEMRKLPCWVLRAKSSAKKLAAAKGERSRIYGDGKGGFTIQNKSIDVFIEELGAYASFSRIIDRTKIDYPVSISLPGSANGTDLKSMNERLRPHGLYLKQARRYIKVFVINDNQKQ